MCTIVKGLRMLLDGHLKPAQIHINESGYICEVASYESPIDQPEGITILDVGNLVVMPGIIDAHVHVNEPGRTDWEGFETATKAAAAGGVTTIVDMPLNCSPVSTTLAALMVKLPHAKRQAYVNVAFWGGVIPGNQAEIKPMLRAGVKGFKCFMVHSGIDEFPNVTEADLHLAYQEMQGTDTVFLFHAEIECSTQHGDDWTKFQTFLESRPDEMEVKAIELIITLCRTYRVRSHIVHLSSSAALPLIRIAVAEGLPLTVETCHHYLTLSSDTIPDGRTEFKCCPPIRNTKNQELLWEALRDGIINMVVSDHSPCTADLKLLDKGDFKGAWGGIAGLQLGLSLFWTSCKSKAFSITDMSTLMTVNTCKHASIPQRGTLQPGYAADIVIWDPDAAFEVTADQILHKNKTTPYLGMELYGVVHYTLVNGKMAYQRGLPFPPPQGKLLL